MSVSDLVADIERSREDLLDFSGTLDHEAAHRPIGPEKWAPIEYVEHLVRAEEATVWRMFLAVEESRRGEPGPKSETPELSIEELTARTWGEVVEAPPLAVPALRGSMAYWGERMRRNAGIVEAFAALVDDSELDTVAYNHPISGPFTMRQGFEFVRFHIDRHLGQMRVALADL